MARKETSGPLSVPDPVPLTAHSGWRPQVPAISACSAMRSPAPDGTTCSRPPTDGFLPCAQVATADFIRQAIFLAATGAAATGTCALRTATCADEANPLCAVGCMAVC